MNAYEEVKDYYPLMNALINGDIEPAGLVDFALRHNDPVLKNTVMLTALQRSNSNQVVLQ